MEHARNPSLVCNFKDRKKGKKEGERKEEEKGENNDLRAL